MEHELQMLLKTPGNECCADCKAIFPRYASITLAIFLCNRCYNIHRCMGAHITHTKSVGFDKWSYEEVGHMSSIGNAIANLYWEGFLSKLFPFQIAPQIIMLLWHSFFTFLMFCGISMLSLKYIHRGRWIKMFLELVNVEAITHCFIFAPIFSLW